jgi:hypothetical protein
MAELIYQNLGINVALAFGTTNYVGQSILVTKSFKLTSIKYYLHTTSLSGNVTANVYNANSSFVPTGEVLDTTTFDGNTVLGANGTVLYEIVFGAKPQFIKDSKYSIILSAVNEGISAYASTGNAYINGTATFSNNSGSSWTTNTTDLYFLVYGELTPELDSVTIIEQDEMWTF